MSKKCVVLCILDGWGIEKSVDYNAPKLAYTPVFDKLFSNYPSSQLQTCGLAVGLPQGQMGNSEVGHMNIGAGRVVMQTFPRINEACENNTFQNTDGFKEFTAKLQKSNGTAHIIGLVSDGGVHGHQNHMIKFANTILDMNIPVKLHIFTDGRDTAPKSAKKYIDYVSAKTQASIATVSGRYWAMDRNNNWDRIKTAVDAIWQGKASSADTAINAVDNAYRDNITDEFIPATVIGDYTGFKNGDGVFCTNFRTDRSRQILTALCDKDFNEFESNDKEIIASAGMVSYSDNHNNYMSVVFKQLPLNNTLGEIVSRAKKIQIRTAETEKYPHVTFFLNGGDETIYKGEERLLSPSPKVATYDLQPEMSAYDVTSNLITRLEKGNVDMVILNFANPDMVGHTGDLDATIKACQAVDECLGKVWNAVQKLNGVLLTTSDHGNCDIMYNTEKDEPHTAHTLNPVPFIVSGSGDIKLKDGVLSDIAPTILELLNIEQPVEMTGKSLINTVY